MPNLFRNQDPQLEKAIAQIYIEMEGYDTNSEVYKEMVTRLIELNGLKNKSIDPNVVLTVAANFAIGIAVLSTERNGVIATKIWSFLAKT